jgi:hypothetical protein
VECTDTYLFRCANNPYIRFPKPWDTYFTLPLSVPISEFLRKTRLIPNMVSVLSLLVTCVSAVFFYLGEWVSLVHCSSMSRTYWTVGWVYGPQEKDGYEVWTLAGPHA